MNEAMSNRREFLAASTSLLGGGWLALHFPAIEAAGAWARRAAAEDLPFEVLSAAEARAFAALAERILPSNGSPGAREANVVRFADRALETFAEFMLPSIRAGIADLEGRTRQSRPPAAEFARLAPEQQDEIVRAVEDSVFFSNARLLTIMGMFADPKYGGNEGGVGWRLIGFENRGAYQPPFGYYDAEYARRGGRAP